MNPPPSRRGGRSAYTLIEALVASGILLVGVGAAASMSLAFVTQEEIGERAVKAHNHLDNAVSLYRAGVAPAEIPGLLPPEPAVTSLTLTNRSITATNLGSVPSVLVTVTWKANGATAAPGVARWTGGHRDAVRSVSVEAVRADRTLASPLPRVDFFD